MRLVYSGDFNYEGYFKSTAVCDLKAYSGNGKYVFIATEIKRNVGTSITNAIEMVAEAVEKKFGIKRLFGPDSDGNSVLIEHYGDMSYETGRGGQEDYSIMALQVVPKSFHYYSNPDWWRVDKSEIERLVGGPVD
jgi:hypothetical protein